MNVMQCRAARVMLSLGVRELAALAGVSPDTVARLKWGAAPKPVTVERIQAALEARGLSTDGLKEALKTRLLETLDGDDDAMGD